MTWKHLPHHCPLIKEITSQWWPEQAVEQTVMLSVIWDAMMLIWNNLANAYEPPQNAEPN